MISRVDSASPSPVGLPSCRDSVDHVPAKPMGSAGSAAAPSRRTVSRPPQRLTWETVAVARSRFRSVRYDLAAAVEVARMADSAGGGIAPDLLAPALGYSGTNNGAYLSRVANARLFGVVSGRGSRLELTPRGRRILDGHEPEASAARREAFLAVPLFRAVVDDVVSRGGLFPGDVVQWLVDDFGETEAKARSVSDLLMASAGQAGLLRRSRDGTFQLSGGLTHFTSVDNSASPGRILPLGLRRGDRSPAREEVAVAEHGLWLEEEPSGLASGRSSRRRWGAAAACVVVLTVAAVPVALVATGSPTRPGAVHGTGRHPRPGRGPAEHDVLSALSATTDSGSFDFSYTIAGTPASATATTTTPTTVCRELQVPVPTGTGAPAQAGTNGGGVTSSSGSYSTGVAAAPVAGPASGTSSTSGGSLPPGYTWKSESVCNGPTVQPSPDVNGGGVINTGPLGMVASANIGGGLDVTVRLNDSTVYEEGSGDTGLTPLASDMASSGTALPQFAGITEGTLGDREGAVAMMGMASPTGYLDLIQPAITAAAQTGTGTVDGTPVTDYLVTNDLDQLAGAAGTSPAESQTISAALTLLKGQGYTSNQVEVSIDRAGFIRQVKTTDAFADGGTVTLQATFSNFGCAGTVVMPGQTGGGVPTAGCTSPDVSTSSNAGTTSTTVGAGPGASAPMTAGSMTTTNGLPSVPSSTTAGSSASTVPPTGVGSPSTTAPPSTSATKAPPSSSATKVP